MIRRPDQEVPVASSSTAPVVHWHSPRDSAPVREAVQSLVGPVRWMERVDIGPPGVLVLDADLPNARTLLHRATGPVIWLGFDLPEDAYDAVEPDASVIRIARSVRAAIKYASLETSHNELQAEVERGEVAGLVVGSAAARTALRTARRAAQTHEPLWISGPDGSGKKTWALAVHRLSPGSPRPSVVDAATLASDDAIQRFFEGPWRAQGVILRDADKLSDAAMRAIALRIDQGERPQRLVFTSHFAPSSLPWPRAILDRLAVLHLTLPALADRGPDIELLATRFLEGLGPDERGRPRRMTRAAAAALRGRRWPGEVAELREIVERAAWLAQDEPVDTVHLVEDSPMPTLDELERQTIEKALIAANGNVSAAGEALGVPRSTLYRKLKRMGIK
jgi:DNA-binding protein Fis